MPAISRENTIAGVCFSANLLDWDIFQGQFWVTFKPPWPRPSLIWSSGAAYADLGEVSIPFAGMGEGNGAHTVTSCSF